MTKAATLAVFAFTLMGCNPTVRVEAPTEPIRIEANITISHEIKIMVEKDVEEVLADDDLF